MALLWIYVFLFGLVIGSFLNVLVYRLPREMPIAHGFSQCTDCGHRLYPKDLVPLFSYLFLRGRCRYCGAHISFQYPAVELANALLWLLCAGVFGFTPRALAAALLCSCLLTVLLIDWFHQIIPDVMCLAILVCGLGLWAAGGGPDLTARLIGFVVISVPLLLLALLSGGRAMGGGDIKLMAALGFCLGWQCTILTTMLGALLGTLAVVALRPTRFALGCEVSFGSFLALGGMIALFWGDGIIGWYLSLVMGA